MSTALRMFRILLRRAAELELLDRVYIIAAGSFVSVLPVLLLITGVLDGSRSRTTSVVADEIIERLGLSGAAADAVRTLLPREELRLYSFGLVITLFGAYSLSRRAVRAYSAIWEIPDLERKELWRGLVWVVIQLATILSVAALRHQARAADPLIRLPLFAVAAAIWFSAELIAQRIITRSRIGWRPLSLAAGLVAVGRLLVAIWMSVYLAGSLARQAEIYGPIGVVFSLFTSLFATIATTLVATLVASVLTRPSPTAP